MTNRFRTDFSYHCQNIRMQGSPVGSVRIFAQFRGFLRGFLGWAPMLFTLVFVAPKEILGHPDGAEPVRHPLVPGFERFHYAGDPPKFLARGGLLLLGELNCVGCHAAPADWTPHLPNRLGPNLSRVGDRLQFEDLWLSIRHPPTARNGTRMPSQFSHPDHDDAEIDAIASYLVGHKSNGRAPDSPQKKTSQLADPEQGKKLFHAVGCVACHAPELTETDEKPNVNSIAIGIAELYQGTEFVDFLLDPKSIHPDGAMPKSGLTASEATDIAAYLQGGTAPSAKATALALARGEFRPDLAEEGRRLFEKRRCVDCHVTEGLEGQSSTPLVDLSLTADRGCNSKTPASVDSFHFGLSDLQREAIRHAVARIRSDPKAEGWTVAEQNDRRLAAENCYACHSHNEKGGLENARAAFTGSPPRPLDGLGDQLFTTPCPVRFGPKFK